MADDLRADIEALCADPFRGYGVSVVLASDLQALLAAHPVQDEGGHAVAFGEIGTPCLNCNASLVAGERAEYVGHDDECDGSAHITCPAPLAAPVQVTTAAELDALPVGSVVLDSDGLAWQKRSQTIAAWWYAANDDAWDASSDEIDAHPVTVLYRPEVTP